MRLPNGFGSVYKLSGNRRNPYIARKTVGWDENGKQQYFTVGYFGTKREGLNALAALQVQPFNLELGKLTFSELYSRWAGEKFKYISDSNVRGYEAAYKYAGLLYDLQFSKLRTVQLQGVVDLCAKGYQTKKKIRILFSQMYRYAMENDICAKDYSAFVRIGPNDGSQEKVPFTDKEIARLWRMESKLVDVDTVLILLYTGLRITELLELRTENIDLKGCTLRGGIKTAAGKNRLIPIHRRILPLIQARYDPGHEYLILNNRGGKMSADNYRRAHWQPLMERLGMCHTPHETRHTFITRANNAEANPISIKRIVGHASGDITDKVYTHKDLEELRKAMDKIP